MGQEILDLLNEFKVGPKDTLKYRQITYLPHHDDNIDLSHAFNTKSITIKVLLNLSCDTS